MADESKPDEAGRGRPRRHPDFKVRGTKKYEYELHASPPVARSRDADWEVGVVDADTEAEALEAFFRDVRAARERALEDQRDTTIRLSLRRVMGRPTDWLGTLIAECRVTGKGEADDGK